VDNKNDLTFTGDDIAEIFGMKEPPAEKEIPAKTKPAEEKKAAAQATVATAEAKPEQKSKIIASKLPDISGPVTEKQPSKSDTQETDYEVDDLIKRAEQIKKELEMEARQEAEKAKQARSAAPKIIATAIPKAVPEPQAKTTTPTGELDYNLEKNVVDIAQAYDEVRKIIYAELMASCGEKACNAMLLKTLEKAAFGNFVFKNTNWDSEGNLKEDGAIDMERLVRNIRGLGPNVRLKTEMEEGLTGLLFNRLKAIKLGLGNEKYETVKTKILKRINIIEAGYRKEIMDAIKNNIIAPAIKKGDEAV